MLSKESIEIILIEPVKENNARMTEHLIKQGAAGDVCYSGTTALHF